MRPKLPAPGKAPDPDLDPWQESGASQEESTPKTGPDEKDSGNHGSEAVEVKNLDSF